MSQIFRLLIVSCTTVSLTPGQLYLVTGTPTPRSPDTYASHLLAVDEDGGVRTRDEIASKDAGTWWIEVDYEKRRLAAITISPRNAVVVVDLDRGAVIKRCLIPPNAEGYGGVEQWMAEVPGRGLWVILHSMKSLSEMRARGMSMDSGVPCDQSFEVLHPDDVKNIIMAGYAGVTDYNGGQERPMVGLERDGRIRKTIGGSTSYLNYQIPDALRASVVHAGLLVNNGSVLIVGLAGRDGDPYRRVAYRKSDHAWRLIPAIGGRSPVVRGFGTFVAITERSTRISGTAESAGKLEWRKATGDNGPNIEFAFKDSKYAYPGRLHLYDVETEKTYSITTNQADSEVLLVENSQVYYRVSNRLYSCPITDKGLGPAKLVATDERIRDAHWAFIKH